MVLKNYKNSQLLEIAFQFFCFCEEKVYEVYILLELSGALYPSELELPAISGWSR